MIYFISKFYFLLSRNSVKRKKGSALYCDYSIVKDISALDFEKSLAKIGQKKGNVLVHNNHPSYMS